MVAWLAEVPQRRTAGPEAVPQRLEPCSQFCQQVCKRLPERKEDGKNEERTKKTSPGAGGALVCVPHPPCRAALHGDISGPNSHGLRPLRPLSPPGSHRSRQTLRNWQGACRSRGLAREPAEAQVGEGRLPPQQQVQRGVRSGAQPHARTPPPGTCGPLLPACSPCSPHQPRDQAPFSLERPAGLSTSSSRHPDSLKSVFEEGVIETGRKVAAQLVGHLPRRERAADG